MPGDPVYDLGNRSAVQRFSVEMMRIAIVKKMNIERRMLRSLRATGSYKKDRIPDSTVDVGCSMFDVQEFDSEY